MKLATTKADNGSTRKIERSIAGLTEVLFQELEGILDGKSDASRAHAVGKLAGTILKGAEVRLNFEVLRLQSKVPTHLTDMKLIAPLSAAA